MTHINELQELVLSSLEIIADTHAEGDAIYDLMMEYALIAEQHENQIIENKNWPAAGGI